jgi:hypothetical protein
VSLVIFMGNVAVVAASLGLPVTLEICFVIDLLSAFQIGALRRSAWVATKGFPDR